MAGIFDFMGGSSSLMTPEQMRALQAAQATPQAAIGVDPVATQQQSRIAPQQPAGRTFYANTAGQMGTQVPGGSGTSGVYSEAADAAKAGGRGLMGRALGVLGGPVVTGAGLWAGGDPIADSELTPDQREAKNPGEQADAAKYAQHIQQLAREAGGKPAAQLIDPNSDMDNPEDAAAAKVAIQQANAPAVIPTGDGPAVQANPVTTEQASAKAAQDTEIKRQTLEQGALNGLATGAVSRPKFAQAVVEADLARSGTQLSPEAQKKAVTTELMNMKSMSNADLSKYISYALMAGGVLAVLLDKSGNAAAGFNQGFNAQLDRNMKMGIQNSKNAQEQAKLNQAMAIQQGEWKRDDRKLDISEKGVDQTGKYNDARIGIAQGGLEIDRGRLSLSQQSEGRQASQGAEGLSIRRLSLQQQQQNADRDYELDSRRVGQGDTANAIRAAKVAQGGTTPPGVALSEKQAPKVVDDFLSSQDVKMDSKSKSAFASQVQQASKNNPEWKTNPAKVMDQLLNQGGYETDVDPGIPFIPFTGGDTRIRQKKMQ